MNKYTPEKSIPIPIKPTTTATTINNSNELGLNVTVNDPSKMSPPDFFMEKLMKRMDNYYSPKDSSNKKFSFN